jgi:hypothetical protein
VFSLHPLQCHLIGDGPGRAAAVANGRWSGKTAGGCFNHPTWINNPKYLMKFAKSSGTFDVEFVLIQGTKTTCFIGVYIFGGYQENQGLNQNQVVKQVQCTNKNEISVRVQMPATSGPFVVMPVTFKAGETNDFQLLIITEEKLSLFELDGTAVQSLKATKLPDFTPKPNVKQPSGYALVVAAGGTSKQITLPKEVSKTSGSSSKPSKPDPVPAPAPKPYVPPKSSPPPKSSSSSSSQQRTTQTTIDPKSKVTTTVDVSKDRKGDLILSFGKSGSTPKKTTTTTATVMSFYCSGCGNSQKKGVKQCTSCGAKLKK